MLREAEERSSSITIPKKLKSGIHALQEAFRYARDVDSDPWEFAVSIGHLEQLGVTETDLRWLVRKGYIEHASEVTVQGDDGRQFRQTGDLTFCEHTCVILTNVGSRISCSVSGEQLVHGNVDGTIAGANSHTKSCCLPDWDAEARRLHMDGELVKRFKWRAPNQETVLTAFQEEGWPERIDDPLPPQPEQDSKRRLADTIKCLNRKQANEIIHFRGDGTGEGVVWERDDRNRKSDNS